VWPWPQLGTRLWAKGGRQDVKKMDKAVTSMRLSREQKEARDKALGREQNEFKRCQKRELR